MSADPIDAGAMPTAAVGLTGAQVRALVAAVGGHRGSIRVEKLDDGYARVVLIGPEGEGVSEQLLFPT
jgi:hypothetical protein